MNNTGKVIKNPKNYHEICIKILVKSKIKFYNKRVSYARRKTND